MALTIDDIRPHLGRLNWALRRMGLVIVAVSDKGVVLNVYVERAGDWQVTCDDCGHAYQAGTDAIPTCPKCHAREAPDWQRRGLAHALREQARDGRGVYINAALALQIAKHLDGEGE